LYKENKKRKNSKKTGAVEGGKTPYICITDDLSRGMPNSAPSGKKKRPVTTGDRRTLKVGFRQWWGKKKKRGKKAMIQHENRKGFLD